MIDEFTQLTIRRGSEPQFEAAPAIEHFKDVTAAG